MRGEIWLGDLARALDGIQPRSDEDARAIARLLGLAAAPRGGPEPAVGAVDAPATEAAMPPDIVDNAETAGAADSFEVRDVTSADAAGGRDLPELDLVGRRPVRPTGWGVRVLDPPGSQPAAPPPGRYSLLPPRGSAAITQALAAQSVAEGPLDVPAIVEVLASRRVPRTLPRLSRPTLRFGTAILVDLGLLMELFAGDQDQVVAQMRETVGEDLISVSYFADVPSRGAGQGPSPTWEPYAAPGRGTRVLVLSDFGLAGPSHYPHRAAPHEWRAFVADLRRHGCDVAGLLPVVPDRWPSWLSSLLPLVCWDRTATVARAAAALKGR
jgi:hypothetical protein